MARYHKYKNMNPKGIETGDCVVRALSYATGYSWDKVYIALCNIGYKEKAMPNSKVVYEKFLESTGFVRQKLSIKKGDTRPTVYEFTKAHKKGLYILSVANHLTVCDDGVYYDTWDCGNCCIYTYWIKQA